MELIEKMARAIYDSDEDAITANIDNSASLSAEAKAEWHSSIGPKTDWPDIHAETQEAYLMRAQTALATIREHLLSHEAKSRARAEYKLTMDAGYGQGCAIDAALTAALEGQ